MNGLSFKWKGIGTIDDSKKLIMFMSLSSSQHSYCNVLIGVLDHTQGQKIYCSNLKIREIISV